jgi:hypothetical protein
MMDREKVVFVRCSLSRGGFPSECVFRVSVFDGGVLSGVAPVHYCYKTDGNRVQDQDLQDGEIDGLVAGLQINQEARILSVVYMPDGELYKVSEDLVSPVRTSGRVPLPS